MHRDHDSEIQLEESDDDSPGSLAHRDPDDRNEAEIKELKRGPSRSEHDIEHKQGSAGLAKHFCYRTYTEPPDAELVRPRLDFVCPAE